MVHTQTCRILPLSQNSRVLKRLALIDAKLLQFFYELELLNLLFLLLQGYLAADSICIDLVLGICNVDLATAGIASVCHDHSMQSERDLLVFECRSHAVGTDV